MIQNHLLADDSKSSGSCTNVLKEMQSVLFLSPACRRSEGDVRVHGPAGGRSVRGGAAAERDRGRLR